MDIRWDSSVVNYEIKSLSFDICIALSDGETSADSFEKEIHVENIWKCAYLRHTLGGSHGVEFQFSYSAFKDPCGNCRVLVKTIGTWLDHATMHPGMFPDMFLIPIERHVPIVGKPYEISILFEGISIYTKLKGEAAKLRGFAAIGEP